MLARMVAMDEAYQSFGETEPTTFVDKCQQWGVALVALMQQWGDSSLVLDEDGELVGWPVFMM
jgi:hypothetical protein